jgi:D-alanyl-D-alanine carboxypeptidase/D-alanyl-D-alanine-endopeptidase (penicillin-binding protein 4)
LSPRLLAPLFLASLLLTLAWPASAERATRSRRTLAVEAGRIIGRLPISVSVRVRDQLLYAHDGNLPRTPASNEKLLLSMALLARFRPAYRIPTTIEGPLPRHGIVNGTFWLVGHGDPELNDAALRRLAKALHARGIRAVRGSVTGVTNTFTRERWAPGWRSIALQFIALPTALTFDANTSSNGFVFDPERRAAAALTADLRALGVFVSKSAKGGRKPAGAHALATIHSAPLASILSRQNLDSNNFDAEVLTKMLGAAASGPPGTIAKGASAIENWSRRHGVAIVAHDGSGLSYADKISANGMTRLLAAAGTERWGRTLRSTLPTAGEGTLAERLGTLRIRAKTGTLLGQVSALSGWLWLQRSRRWAEFSILSHGMSNPQAVAEEDRLVSMISAHA